MKPNKNAFLAFVLLPLLAVGCVSTPNPFLGQDTIPLKEYTLQGSASEKILVIPVTGMISDDPKEGLIATNPSLVQDVVSQLRKAERDKRIRAVVLKIDSPGGSVTASDLLYREIADFKQRSGAKVVVAMMDLAASGGYYIALPADHIVAHPTTLTGSVGVIFLVPKVTGLMEKIGVGVNVNKSGKNKDMGSPFRPSTKEEEQLLQDLTDRLGKRFVDLVRENRKLDPKALEEVATARVFLAPEALKLGLVDSVGYVSDALRKAQELAGLPEDARVIVYRRVAYPNDTVYNTRAEAGALKLVDLGVIGTFSDLRTGFYYLWPVAAH
jgi:protease-4